MFDPAGACRVQAVSPKRNAQRRAFKVAYEALRRNATKLDSLINERNINDATFEEYPALGDLFYVVYDDLCRDGGDQIAKMGAAVKETKPLSEGHDGDHKASEDDDADSNAH